ncbi:MAG: lipase maturation factor family protein [Geobacteraceae bacterium]|nr:lipase maturation factor family protein [Geobacteraceae bacterium]
MSLHASGLLLPWLFPRLLGGVYLLAFASLLAQVRGLYGCRGVLPIGAYLAALRRELGGRDWRLSPTLFWLNASDRVLLGSACLGVALSLLLVAGWPPVPLLALLWLLYLSFCAAGQEFLSYQWDALLLEAGFMTIFLPLVAPAPLLVVFTYRFFLFRFILSAGAVKLTSGDPAWRDLTALCHHYQTQPLPNRVGWYAHHLPRPMQKLSTIGTFFFELAVPFLALGPAPARLAGFILLLLFQGLIFATGNYGFFNILTVVLLVPLLDDSHFGLLGGWLPQPPPVAGGPVTALLVSAVFALFLLFNLGQLIRLFWRPPWLSRLLVLPSPLMISNPYGLFAVMTTNRFEFVIEGSNDLQEWLPYEFRWKPGDPRRPPRQAAPHQPRLDWQMWFAALDPRTIEPWLGNLVVRLLEGASPVLALLARNPFPEGPPRFIRLTVYRYRFATAAARRREGLWWEREPVGRFQPMTLRGRDAEP